MATMILDHRLGPWQTALADVEAVDATIFDAPYSAKVHEGNELQSKIREGLGYEAMTPEMVAEHVGYWSPRTRGWFCSITCHVLAPVWTAEMERAGRLVFPPLPIVDEGMTVRLQGDGPSSWTCFLIVGRPRSKVMAKWGTLRGAYRRRAGDPRSERRGGKPLGVMREIVRDYSRPGDLVLDTHVGGGTTPLAAILEGRRAIGAEVDEGAFHDAQERLRPHVERCTAMLGIQAGRTLDLFSARQPGTCTTERTSDDDDNAIRTHG
jgi:site-specific DNA-methyltransferase (adenine-specific)